MYDSNDFRTIAQSTLGSGDWWYGLYLMDEDTSNGYNNLLTWRQIDDTVPEFTVFEDSSQGLWH